MKFGNFFLFICDFFKLKKKKENNFNSNHFS